MGSPGSSSAMRRAAPRIFCQSSTASRTSERTLRRSAAICLRSSRSVSRSISTWIQDSTTASCGSFPFPAAPAPSCAPAAGSPAQAARVSGNWVSGTCARSSRPTESTSSSFPVRSRRTTICGWITAWMPRPLRESSLVTESTRNGMSSVTTSTTECVHDQPFSSIDGEYTRTFAVPCGRSSASR